MTQPVSHYSFPKLQHIEFTQYIGRNATHFFQKEAVTTQYSSSKSVTHLTGLHKEEPGWLPRTTLITHD